MQFSKKITAFALSCLLLGSQHVMAMTEADASKKLNDTMNNAKSMLLTDAGHDFVRFLSLVSGGDTSVNDSSPIAGQMDLGDAPFLVAESKDGKIEVIASRRGKAEIGLDLTTDPVHVAIVKELDTKGWDKEVTVYYKDKTGASFKVVAWSIGKLQEDQKPESRLQGRNVYVATEVEVISIPEGQVDANAPVNATTQTAAEATKPAKATTKKKTKKEKKAAVPAVAAAPAAHH